MWKLTIAAFLAPIFAFAAQDVVWVSAGVDGSDTTGDGTEAHPYKTIQKGVDEVATGGTVKIKAGVYDKGEILDGGCSNRVNITKKLTLEGVGGKENVHIVGHKTNSGNGVGDSAVRPIRLAAAAYGSIIKGITIRDGATKTGGNNSITCYGGGVAVAAATGADVYVGNGAYLVDCVVSNCAADAGGGLYGVTAVRCLIANNKTTGWGAGAIYCKLLNCLIVSNQCTHSSNTRGAITDSYCVNCTVACNTGSKTRGMDKRISGTTPTSTHHEIYNCVSFGNGSDSNDLYGSLTIVTNTYTKADNSLSAGYDANLLRDPANGDYRLSLGTCAVGGGLTEHLAVIALPDAISDLKYIDFAGNAIDTASATCDPGCLQLTEQKFTITAANGGITVSGASIGENVVEVGDTVTITPAAGTRPCVGVTVNGVTNLFDDVSPVSITVSPGSGEYTVGAIYTKDWYVNANAENDNGTGFRPGDPKKYLVSALALAAANDTVHAASGRYEEESYMLAGGRPCRAYVPEYVTLVADDGPENTFIIGAPSEEPKDSYGLGLGTNGMSCVCVARYAHVRGFTLTGGCTDYSTTDSDISRLLYTGGGAVGASESYRADIYVEDCIISNNCASFGGGARAATLVRCRVFENKALNSGGGIAVCNAYGTVFDRNRQGTATTAATCRNITRLVGCTITPANLELNGTTTNRAIGAVTSSAGQFHGCLILGSCNNGGRTKFDTNCTYCVFAGSSGGFPTDESCTIVTGAEARKLLDADFRPIIGDNPAVDAWDAENFAVFAATRLSTGKDLSGEPRMRNGRYDIGALESDPKPWYAKLLDGKGRDITVTEADGGITNIAHGVTLRDGMEMSLTWTSAANGTTRTGRVCVTGGGTLTMTKDGAPYATYTEADGEVEFCFAAAVREVELGFSFDGEGSADVHTFHIPVGMMFTVR